MSRNLTLALFLALLLVPCAQNLHAQQEARKSTITTDYLLALPDGYADGADKEWPLLVFLHGAGERGHDINMVKTHGPPKLIEAGQSLPFIVVSPQCPEGGWWSPVILNNLLDEVMEAYDVDDDRVYLTGLSMGGFGTWAWASENPDRFAAIAPICGGGDPEEAWKLRHLPVWVFHGAKDMVVPISSSEVMVNALKDYDAEVEFTVYPEAGHDSWTETYANPAFFDWLLSHKRHAPEAVPVEAAQLQKYAGTYQMERGGEITFRQEGDKLIGKMGDNDIPMVAEGKHRFHFGPNAGSMVTFVPSLDGKVASVTINSGIWNVSGQRVN